MLARTYVESERVDVGYHRFACANAESTLPLVARCVIASSVSALRIAYIFLRSNMRISKFNGRARVSRLARLARERNATATPREARDGASRILLNALISHASDVDDDRVGQHHEARKSARALLLVAEARPRAWRVRTSCRRASTRFYTTIRQFLFSLSLCVRDVFLFHSRPFSRRLLRARVPKDSRRRAGPPER